MRTADEQLRLVLDRAKRQRHRRLRRGAAAACLLLAAALGVLLPRTGGAALPRDAAYGSLILSSPILSYVVIAILAFALGVCITLLCVHRRAERGRTEDEDS